jgi:Fic/DOC family protein
MEGPGPIEGDSPFFGMHVSQQARAFLENMQVSKRSGPDSKTLSMKELEEKLEKILQINGEKEINNLREHARAIAEPLKMQKEFEKLNRLIGSLLQTNTSKNQSSPAAKARAFGILYDIERMKLFELLFIALKQRPFMFRPDKNTTAQSFNNFAFFESYFSNYIEGTVFDVSEAKQIIQTQKPIPARNEDSHDVLGTYHIVSSRDEMKVTPKNGDQLLELLQHRHKILLSARKDKNPGLFKDKNNYAGNSTFVDYNLVRGTLLKACEFYKALDHPFSRAIFMKFMVSEVHPFLDGNGRIARVMMNAELVAAGQSKIIIPTVVREDYVGSLRRLTRQSDPDTYIRVMTKAHEFSDNVYDIDIDEMESYLRSCNAFLEPTEGKLRVIRRE